MHRFLISLTITAAGCLVAVAMTNTIVDPFGCYTVLTSAGFQDRSHLHGTRTAKAELVASADWNCALIGSSRVEIGIDPCSAVWRNRDVCNLGLTACCMSECRFVLERTVQNPAIREIVLCPDFTSFNEVRTPGADFEWSRFNPQRTPYEYYLETALGSRALLESCSILLDNRRHPPQIRRDGFRPATGNDLTPTAQRRAIENQLRKFIEWDDLFGNFQYTGRSMNEFRHALVTCRDRQVTVRIAVLPFHSLLLETVRACDLWPAFEQWKHDLVVTTDEVYADDRVRPVVWDFTGYRGPNGESIPAGDSSATLMEWYWEASHFRAELGEFVMQQVLSDAPVESILPGRRLTASNLSLVNAEIRAERAEYLRQRPEDAHIVRELVHGTRKSSRLAALHVSGQ